MSIISFESFRGSFKSFVSYKRVVRFCIQRFDEAESSSFGLLFAEFVLSSRINEPEDCSNCYFMQVKDPNEKGIEREVFGISILAMNRTALSSLKTVSLYRLVNLQRFHRCSGGLQ